MKGLGLFALIVVSAMWGAHAVVGKAVEHQLLAYPLTAWRFTFGAILYLPWYGRLKSIAKLGKRTLFQLTLTGLLLSVLYPLFYYQSLTTLTPVESLLLVNTSPLIALFLGWIMFHERISKYAMLGIFISFIGVLVLVVHDWSGRVNGFGVFFALIGAAAFAGYSVLSRQLFQMLPLTDVLLSTSLIGTVCIWLLAPLISPKGGMIAPLIHLTPAGWWQLGYIVVIVSTVAYALYGYGLKRVPAGIASAVTFYPQALFAALLQWLVLGLAPSIATYGSALLILGGTALMRRGEQRLAVLSIEDKTSIS